MTKQKQMTEKELDQVAGGLDKSSTRFRSVRGVQSANGDVHSPDDVDGPGRKLVCDGADT